MPSANITGFTGVSEAIKYAKKKRVAIAFIETVIGKQCGIELCQTLLDINPLTNVIFLTSHTDLALQAWNTGASGFLTKPLHLEDIDKELAKLRHPIQGLA